MRFIHTADLHLAAPFGGLVDAPNSLQQIVQQATFAAFRQIVDLAIQQQVDFVVIAGDVFDSPQPSAKAIGQLIEQLQRLADASIPVVMGFGNHDHQVIAKLRIQLPVNVHLLGNQVETVNLTTDDATTVAITGFSYEKRWEQTSIVDQYPARGTSDFQIGLLHGGLGHSGDSYAPFNLQMLNSKNYDYWALGHIHQRQILQQTPPVVYPGDPQGLSIKETGAKGCYLVETQQQKLIPTFVPLAGPVWRVDDVQTRPGLGDQQQIDYLLQQLQPEKTFEQWQLTQIRLSLNDFTPGLLALLNGGQLLTNLQQALTDSQIWPVAIIPVADADENELPKLDATAWQTAAHKIYNIETLTETAGGLFSDPVIRQALTEIPAQDWQQAGLRYLQANYQSNQKLGDHDAN